MVRGVPHNSEVLGFHLNFSVFACSKTLNCIKYVPGDWLATGPGWTPSHALQSPRIGSSSPALWRKFNSCLSLLMNFIHELSVNFFFNFTISVRRDGRKNWSDTRTGIVVYLTL